MKPKKKTARLKNKIANKQRSAKIAPVFKEVSSTPSHLNGRHFPVNISEEQEKFFLKGITPQFQLGDNQDDLEKLSSKKKAQIRFDLLQEAKSVISIVKSKYPTSEDFWVAAFGPKIELKEATDIVLQYLNENNVSGEIKCYWSPDLTATARMCWSGPNIRYNKPEARTYSLILRSKDNNYMRERGMRCLADHEIGTHYLRAVNDGLQPWYSDRKKFDLRPMKSREVGATEEGLAALNTLVHAKVRYLYGPAMAYYTACMAAEMSFKQLYDHLQTFTADENIRWRQVMRVKRGLADPSQLGGVGFDQCYFEGAVEILRNVDSLDFSILYSGKIASDEVSRVRRLARMDCIRTPKFLSDINKYRRILRSIANLNNITHQLKIPKTLCSSFLPALQKVPSSSQDIATSSRCSQKATASSSKSDKKLSMRKRSKSVQIIPPFKKDSLVKKTQRVDSCKNLDTLFSARVLPDIASSDLTAASTPDLQELGSEDYINLEECVSLSNGVTELRDEADDTVDNEDISDYSDESCVSSGEEEVLDEGAAALTTATTEVTSSGRLLQRPRSKTNALHMSNPSPNYSR